MIDINITNIWLRGIMVANEGFALFNGLYYLSCHVPFFHNKHKLIYALSYRNIILSTLISTRGFLG